MAMSALRRKKLLWVLLTLAGTVIAIALILYSVREQTDYYFDPTAISQNEAPSNTRIRAGGMVVKGSIQRAADNPLKVKFAITDYNATVPVEYQGILPDLFKEESGIVATGKLIEGTFVASEVLAKHDENYMPPEVAKSLEKRHDGSDKYQKSDATSLDSVSDSAY